MSTLPDVHIVYENPAWLPPLVDALERAGFAVHLVELDHGLVDPAQEPAPGIWINRISPSSHTRGHEGSVELTRELLVWLEAWGRRVINGSRAYELEMSKLRQDVLLRRHGLPTPRTVLAVGRDSLLRAAATFEGPFITKHNRGGKGLGIQLFGSADALELALDAGTLDPAPGGQFILQQYIDAPAPFITRVELVGGELSFAMRSNTEQGFMLCPSDACQIQVDVCPIDGAEADPGSKFAPSPLTADDPLVRKLGAFCRAEGIDIAGIEFIVDQQGNRYVYDVNGTTNYNLAFGARQGIDAWGTFAGWLASTAVARAA